MVAYVYTAIFFVALILFEVIYSTRKDMKAFDAKDSLVSIAFGVFGVACRLGAKGITLLFYLWLYEFRLFDLGNGWVAWLLCFLANDFIYYWFHRWSHEYRFLWATHVNHHSSMYMNFTTAARTPFLNAVHHIFFWAPLPLLGFDPAMVLIIESIGFLFAFLQHTRVIPKLGPIEWIVNTPSHHRVHHGSNPQYLDKNYGNTLIIFDRMFGTFEEEGEEVRYGITKNVGSYYLPKVAFHEWQAILKDMRKAPNFRDKWRYMFGRVGWHQGEGEGTPEKQA